MSSTPHSGHCPLPQVPAAVTEAICDRWPGRGPRWLAAAPSEIFALCQRYDGRIRQTFSARYGLVVSVETSHGHIVLKSTPDPDAPLQAAAARQLAALRVGPPVHEVIESEFATSIVMEQVLPGVRAIRNASIDELGELLNVLKTAPVTLEFPPISAWLRNRLVNGAATDLPPGVLAASAEERAQALPVLDDLVRDESRTFIHGDISSGNVLRGPFGLRLIDPRAATGDPEYDVAVLALKSGHQLAELARRAAANSARVEAWAMVAVAARV